jgi:hypothetical protein
MALIEKQDKTEKIELKVKIRPEVVGDLNAYASFVDSEIWYVVQELLRDAMTRDKDFQAHLGKGKKKVAAIKTESAEVSRKGAA